MEPHTFTTTGTLGITSGTDFRVFSSGTVPASPNNTVSFNTPINFTQATSKQIMQNKVAVFHVIRDEDEKIIKTEFIKELWVETKNGQSVDFQVARDKDLAEYEMSDLSIRTILTVSF
jgi:ribosomal protein L1